MERLRRLYILDDARNYPLASDIAQKLGITPEYVPGIDDVPVSDGDADETLVLAVHRGRIVKRCPGTRRHICCNYHVVNQVLGCGLGCAYCILQDYLNVPGTLINVNIEDTFRELDRAIARRRKYIYRVGTGELADSFHTDELTGFSRRFVTYARGKAGMIFELKTKSDRIDHILDLDPGGGTVVSWSLNARSIARREEKNAPTMEERLAAAKRAADAGYFIGFHFDPLVDFPGWEDEYRDTVRMIFDFVDPGRIVWVSLGTFRCPPGLMRIIDRRYPDSVLISGESFPGDDGKLRYLKSIRVEMYAHMVRWLKEADPDLFVYLCMERHDVWERVFGPIAPVPKNNAGLDRLFHESLARRWMPHVKG
jgi:spore photoproduct lyase